MDRSIAIAPAPADSVEAERFIELPLRLYSGSPYHVPWFRSAMLSILARRHPWFDHSDAEFFIARRRDEAVGRIAMLEPRRYNEVHGTREARFYFFESVDDPAVSDALFGHAETWTRRRGLDELVGPQGFSSFSGSGILIHGFDRMASMTMMPYHHPYYRALVERCGFKKLRDFHSPWLDASRHDLPNRYERAAEIARRRGRFTVPEYRSKRALRAIAGEIRDAYNDAWRDREVFTPLTERELEQIVDDLLLVSRPELIRILRSSGELAGFILCFPDLSPIMAHAKGRLTPWTLARLLVRKRTARRFLINGFGLRPDFRKSGGTAILFQEITRVLRANRVDGAEMTQIADDNELMMANVDRLGADIVKTHRVYRRSLR